MAFLTAYFDLCSGTYEVPCELLLSTENDTAGANALGIWSMADGGQNEVKRKVGRRRMSGLWRETGQRRGDVRSERPGVKAARTRRVWRSSRRGGDEWLRLERSICWEMEDGWRESEE